MRTLLSVLMFSSLATAAEPVKPLAEKKRKEIVAELRTSYDARMKRAAADVQKAKALLTNPDTAIEGEMLLADAESRIATLKADPFSRTRLYEGAKAGSVGPLPHTSVFVVDARTDATIVDVAFKIDNDAIVARFALVPPITDAVAGKSYRQSGLWHSAGTFDKLTYLQRVEVKPEELPDKKK